MILLNDHIWQSYSYEYHFHNNLAKGNISNSATADGQPKFLNRYYGDQRMLQSLSVSPVWTRLGAMFVEDSALRSDDSVSDNFGTNPPYTIVIWMYVTIVGQDGWLFSKVDIHDRDRSSLWFYINNGKLKVRTQNWEKDCSDNGRLLNQDSNTTHRNLDDDCCTWQYRADTKTTSGSSYYKLGWNLLSFTETSTTIKFRSAPNFGTLITEPFSNNLNYSSENDAIIGGWRHVNQIQDQPTGILHSLYIINSDLTNNDLNVYLVPGSGCPNICDYYVAMYTDLTQYYNNSSEFLNLMSLLPYENSSIVLQENNSVPEADGLNITGTSFEFINKTYDDWVSISYQIWFNGTITDAGSATSNAYFMSIQGASNQINAYMLRNGNDIIYGSKQTSQAYETLTGVFDDSNSNPILLGLGMGWLGDNGNNDHVICSYFFQASNAEKSGCTHISVYAGSGIATGSDAKFKFENANGYVKEIYVLDYIQFPYLTVEYNSLNSYSRFNCHK